MSSLQPIYTLENCVFCCPLTWAVAVFWRTPVQEEAWFDSLYQSLEPDGIRLLGHRFTKPGVSQFAVSTQPSVAPRALIQRVKGRLQHVVRDQHPKALKRNFAVRSFGRVTRAIVEGYVEGQLKHHRFADQRTEQLLERCQILRPEVDLSKSRFTSHGIYWHNLHLVLVHQERWTELRPEVLATVRVMILKVTESKGYLLARAAILGDHMHLALGCPFEVAPADVALSFLNNLAFVHGMRPVFQFGAYVGTFGEYDQRVVMSKRPKREEELPGAGD
jgi:REP element-mobilizing transposase RayT